MRKIHFWGKIDLNVMREAILFSYAILPKELYKTKDFEHNDLLHSYFSLTAASAFEAYSSYLLYKSEKIDRIIIMGCKTFGEETLADSELMANYLDKLGVPKSKITIDKYGFNFVSQIKRVGDLIGDNAQLLAVTLDCHSQRAKRLLRAYGLNPKMVTIEEVFESQIIPQDLLKHFEIYLNGEVKPKLEAESKILLLLQSIDPRGYLQLFITKLRGIRYFNVDITPTLVKPITLK